MVRPRQPNKATVLLLIWSFHPCSKYLMNLRPNAFPFPRVVTVVDNRRYGSVEGSCHAVDRPIPNQAIYIVTAYKTKIADHVCSVCR